MRGAWDDELIIKRNMTAFVVQCSRGQVVVRVGTDLEAGGSNPGEYEIKRKKR